MDPCSEEAVCWSLQGAKNKAMSRCTSFKDNFRKYNILSDIVYDILVEAIYKRSPNRLVLYSWNDVRAENHAEVMMVIEKAIHISSNLRDIMDVSVRAVLEDTRDLISNPEHWTTGTGAARNTSGEIVHPLGSSACRWGLIGAIKKVTPESYIGFIGEIKWKAVEKLTKLLPYGNIRYIEPDKTLVKWNDRSNHSEVILLLDLAIRNEIEPVARGTI